MTAPVRILSVDNAPDDLYPQVPFGARLLRRVVGPDRPDYWLAHLDLPLSWSDSGTVRAVTHLILAARYVGQTITESVDHLTVVIAYVTDSSAIADASLDLSKCRYVAIGEMEIGGEGVPRASGT